MEKKNDFSNECNVANEELLQKIMPQLTPEEDIYEMSDIFKAFSDPTRLSIIDALLNAELCVCDLATLLGISQPAVSHHLKSLKQSRIVKYRRDGKQAYYSLDDEHIHSLFEICRHHIKE